MPNIREVEVGVELAGTVLERVAPNLSQRIAGLLPEIFGTPAKVADTFEHAPGDAVSLNKLALQYQRKLKAYDLPTSAEPGDLYSEVVRLGAHPEVKITGGRGYAIGDSQLTFDDGTKLQRVVMRGRSISSETTSFLNADETVSLSHEKGSFLRDFKEMWKFRTQATEGAVNVTKDPNMLITKRLGGG